MSLVVTNQAADGKLIAVTAAVVVALAVMGNTLFKAGFVLFYGAPHLRRICAVAFTIMVAAAVGGVIGARALFGVA